MSSHHNHSTTATKCTCCTCCLQGEGATLNLSSQANKSLTENVMIYKVMTFVRIASADEGHVIRSKAPEVLLNGPCGSFCNYEKERERCFVDFGRIWAICSFMSGMWSPVSQCTQGALPDWYLYSCVVVAEVYSRCKRKWRKRTGSIITYITGSWPLCKVSVAPSTFQKLFNSVIHIKALRTPAAKLKGQTAHLHSDALITIPLWSS